MKKVLITGATGNVGMEVLKSLSKIDHDLKAVAGLRDLKGDAPKLSFFSGDCVLFDFTDQSTFPIALNQIDVLFLLRPPQISEVSKYFKPLIEEAQKAKVQHIVFLSVQGVEKSGIIPHHKIEKLIVESGIAYTFLRPAYFMQNFTSTLHADLVQKHLIFLPAGKAKFTLVDVRDIGTVAAMVLKDANQHLQAKYDLTCDQKLTFQEMAQKLSLGLGISITYQSPNLIQFYLQKRKEKIPIMLILVMIMLHYLPRFQKDPLLTDCVKNITGKEAYRFEEFISDHKSLLLQ